ncbi:MAG: Gfo/Idh/MocA family oxidoreductase [Streptosporangiales bacterium]
MNRELRVCLVGAGRAGQVHAKNLAEGVRGARLAAVADPDHAAGLAVADRLGVAAVVEDPVAAVTSDDVDAVVVAAPTFTHADIVVSALEAGKHVLCEKPLAATLDGANRVAAAARAAPSVFVMGFMRRFDPRFRRAAERVAAGDIGAPILVRSTCRGPGLPPEWAWDAERSGGLAAEVNSHDLDTVRWLSGQDVTSVHAVGRAAKRPDIARRYRGFVDVLVATLELSDGGLGTVDGACPADYGYDARAEVYGTEGTLLIGSPLADAPLLVRAPTGTVDAVGSWQTLFASAYRAEDEHFVRAALGHEEPHTTALDGVRALEAAVAVNMSMARSRAVSIEEVRAQ